MEQDTQDAKIAELRDTFNMFDTDGDGTISIDELATVMRQMGQVHSDEEIVNMIKETTGKDKTELEFEEFVTLLNSSATDEVDEEEDMRQAFKVFDKDGSGTITAEELRYVMTNLGEKMTDEEVDEMVREADKDGDGEINYQEFVAMMQSK